MHGASEQCMQATEIERSPGTPSLIVTTRRRFTPHGMSCSCLHAVTQPLHSMQRSASHRNFIRAMVPLLDAFQRRCRLESSGSARDSRGTPSDHSRFSLWSAYTFATWQSVVLVSCIIVTES